MSTTTASSSSSVAAESRNWLDLPADVMAKILLKLGAIEIIESAQKVCVSWRRICQDSSMWRQIDMWNNLSELRHSKYDLEKMCRHAVDRSDGQLIDINIEYFGTDELLHYITERISGLKRLRLFICYNTSVEGLIEVAPKLPLLEELELTICPISKDALEAIGKSCRLLNFLKFNQKVPRCEYVCDDEALAIAENMPGLRHLQLVGNALTNKGLQAILNGCSQLESLDLRGCRHLRLKGSLEKACADQVNSLELPGASMDDYPFCTRFFL